MRKLNLYVIILTATYFISACDNSSSNKKETGVSFDLTKETEWVKNEVIKFSNDLKKGDSLGLSQDFITKYFDAVHLESINHQNKISERFLGRTCLF